MGDEAEGEVAACGVACEDYVLGRFMQRCEDVVEYFGGLAELAWVGGVGGKGVGWGEDGEGGVRVGCFDDGGEEGEVARADGEVVAAACRGLLVRLGL